MKHRFDQAFTLVELIVVISIVGILSTVGFVSYSKYLLGARDSNRIAQMVKISDSLQVYATNKSLPLPDDKVDITASGKIIAYQGNLGTQVMETVNYNDAGLDPKDKTPFTYMVSKDRKSLQLLALMEENQGTTAGITPSYAVDYSDRYPRVYGQRLGILTNQYNIPLQDLSVTGATLDIISTTLTLKSFLSDTEYVVDSGSAFADLQSIVPVKGKMWRVEDNAFVYGGRNSINPRCSQPDIIIGSQTWAGCNSISGDGFEWGKRNDGTDGTIDGCRDYDGSDDPFDPNCAIGSPLMASTADPKDFFDIKQIDGVNTYEDSEYSTIWGKLYTWDQAMAGACPEGWRVPSDDDWDALENTIIAQNGGSRAGIGWASHNLKNDMNNVANALRAPLTGFRLVDGESFVERGYWTYFWSSTANVSQPTKSYTRALYSDYDDLDSFSSFKNLGLSVRCLKN